jgi:hypothetical protein
LAMLAAGSMFAGIKSLPFKVAKAGASMTAGAGAAVAKKGTKTTLSVATSAAGRQAIKTVIK